jgi:hypothetical protein
MQEVGRNGRFFVSGEKEDRRWGKKFRPLKMLFA